MLKNPKHGFGSGMNPCIDCRAMMYEAAKDHMETIAVLVTGEVLSQRPMSQHRQALRTIEEESDLVGKVIRPLSAGRLTPSDAETSGFIDRSKLILSLVDLEKNSWHWRSSLEFKILQILQVVVFLPIHASQRGLKIF